jgi:hypothetical protein
MNSLITILIPIIGISLISRIFQYICNIHKGDKILSLIIITVIQLCLMIYVVAFLNNLSFNLLLFLSLIVIVLTNALHMSIDSQELNIRTSKGTSMFISFLIQGFLLSALYFIII